MKILVPALGRINTQNRDGSEIRFSAVAKIWKKKGHEIHIVLPPREKRILKTDGVEVKYYLLPEKTTYEGENLFVILLIYLARLIKAFLFSPPKDADLLYIPSDFLIDLLPGLWWRRQSPRAKVVVCFFLVAPNPFKGYRHGYQEGWRFPTLRSILYFTSQWLTLFLLKSFADKILVLNSLDKAVLEKRGLAGKVSVIDMGVDFQEFNKAPRLAKVYDACFVGRFHPQKGIFDLIDIWKTVVEKESKAKLALIGGGSKEFKEKLKMVISKEGLSENIVFLGFKIDKEKVRVLKQSKLFLLPSFYESWGMVAAEAMAAGLPVVAYDLPIFSKIFPWGMIRVPIGEKKAFTRAVLSLLEDKDLYQKLRKEAQRQAREYDWHQVANRELSVFPRIANEP